ncbi:MAG: c-type cytochrome [Spirosoma sp.]|nr:c-type cytochrome [Spirosoma sp.]
MKRTRTIVLAVASVGFLLTASFVSNTDVVPAEPRQPQNSRELGEVLFNDVILSVDRTKSCASCHKAAFAFADNMAKSPGVNGNITERNTPSVMYLSKSKHFFWDGRARTYEEQALGPIASPKEMGLALPEAEKRLKEDVYYQAAFQRVFKTEPSLLLLSKALADFQRTLAPHDSPFDRYSAGNMDALSPAAIRGMEVFIYDANCVFCHKEPYFDNDEYFNIGLYNGKDRNDKGRFGITKDSADLGSFETPPLRNIALTAPYMHDGSINTLEEVIDFYNDPNKLVNNSRNRHKELKPLKLTKQKVSDLMAFLNSLTDDSFAHRKPPIAGARTTAR